MIEIFGAIVVAMLLYAVRSAWLGAAILVAALVVLAPLSSLAVYGTVDRWLYFGLVYLAAAGVNFYESLSLKFANKREKQLAEAIEHLRDRFARRRVTNEGKP